ncbi:stage II sporulation protein B [Cerasibacillus quisquiliarum]|uniref:SPOR domain-containing protein n=1 Tax=Cerasibacillus quisquiliarum TaxID=227865 RepID=A0A511V094_9BACI|nr:SPOR domain-containing protein [Cerasibacillus quisquiliarum]MBB5145637.1 stage II sporulation protein B [Cerasibacillus quisquiliarum]GEN31431.1 hypothetical protein CQU01_16690 [Cerasibacillus quisquiliarum]
MNKKKKLTFKINQKPSFKHKRQMIRKPRPSLSSTKRHQASRVKKNVMFATGSALIIGTIFGIVMLKMFATLDETSSYQSTHISQTTAPHHANHTKRSKQSKKTHLLSELQAYVIQAGMFSERANAEALLSQFQGKDVDGVIWQRDGYYYLFVNVVSNEAAAKKMIKLYEQENLETFVKQWLTSEVSHTLTEVEQEWLTSFQVIWNETLRAYTENNDLNFERWEQLYKQTMKTKEMQEFLDSSKPILSDLTKDPAIFLLKIWLAYENFIYSLEDSTFP